jgi:AcrR family transcriptional regulator
MARPAQTDAEFAARRSEVVDAATNLLTEFDVEGVSMRAIAAAIECSRMTPYHYFENKEQILQAVRANSFRRLTNHLDAATVDVGAPIERLRAEMFAFVAFALDEPNSYRSMFQTAPVLGVELPELTEETERAFAHAQRTGQSAVDAGVVVGDALTAYHVIWSFVHGLISLHLSGQFVRGRTVDEVLVAAIDLFLRAADSTPPPANTHNEALKI